MKIGILGGGQLAGLLAQEIIRTDDTLVVLDPSDNCPASFMGAHQIKGSPLSEKDIRRIAKEVDILTVEIENVNTDILKIIESEGLTILPKPETLEIIKNKLQQKSVLHKAGIPTCDFFSETKRSVKCRDELGWPLVQKAIQGGYDGRGVAIIPRDNSPSDWLSEPSYFEEFVPEAIELAIMIARDTKGNERIWEPTQMEFDKKRNILSALFSPPSLESKIIEEAKKISIEAVRSLEGIGLFGVELFLKDKTSLFVNEIAPRTHNSGHHSIDACETSQFRQQYNILSNKPLTGTAAIFPTVMFNLLGEPGFEGKTNVEGEQAANKIDGVFVHLYNKINCSPYRKMGHVTVVSERLKDAKEKASKVRSLIRVRGDKKL